MTLLVGADGYLPDFLTSTPAGADKRLLQALADDPARARALAVDAWRQVWDAVLAPSWPQLERILRADIGTRSRRVTTHGLGTMIDTLHEAVTWAPDAVHVRLRAHGEVLDCAGSGLVLVPSVMAPRCAVVTEPPAQPTLFYPALGVSERWADHAPDTSRALAALLGAGRAGVLLALRGPLSTSEVAAAGGLAVSTASHHLGLLRDAGLVTSRRDGPWVLHERTPLGEAVVGG